MDIHQSHDPVESPTQEPKVAPPPAPRKYAQVPQLAWVGAAQDAQGLPRP
jgi:hypothetical protein